MKYLIILISLMFFGCDMNQDLVNVKFCWRGQSFIIAGCDDDRCSVITDSRVNGLPHVEVEDASVLRTMLKHADKECP